MKLAPQHEPVALGRSGSKAKPVIYNLLLRYYVPTLETYGTSNGPYWIRTNRFQNRQKINLTWSYHIKSTFKTSNLRPAST